jgi:type II secretory pathway pseudopilin PulG
MKKVTITMRALTRDDEGFSLIEIVVSLFLLAALAICFLPILIQGLKQTANNATIATATQLANTELDAARSQTSCASITSGTTNTTDSRGVALAVTTLRGTCPTTFPKTVSYRVTVTRIDTGATLVKADTLVLVTG